MTSPTSVPLRLLALDQAAQPGTLGDLAVGGDSAARVTSDAQLRSAIVNVAGYYLRLAKTRTPAQMEALIWDKVSSDGADHGPTCAAFAALTLELAAQAVGQQSWVTGGDTYPWPIADWADVRVDTNPDSPGITSLVADAQARERWHPLGDGYQPRPGDWAVYDQHVEVVTSYSHGVLDTIGADSLPDLTVNAHSSAAPLAEQGVTGFVDNGNLKPAGAAGSPGAAPGQGATAAPAVAAETGQNGGGKAGEGNGATGKAATRKAGPGSASTGQADSGKSGSGQAAPSAPDRAVAAIPGIPATGAVTQFGASHGAEQPRAGASQPSDRTPASDGAHAGRHPGVAVSAAVPGVVAAGDLLGRVGAGQAVGSGPADASASTSAAATIPGLSHSAAGSAPTDSGPTAGSGAIAIPGAAPAHAAATPTATPSTTHPTPPTATPSAQPTPTSAPSAASTSPSTAHASSPGRQYATPGTRDQQAFISMVAPGAMAAQQRFGVPAAVTIAQAIEESAWGRSGLAANYHNLFGIKGSGPAGRVSLPTSEFQGGQWVTIDAPFRVYHNDAESIADHAELLATSGYYTRAMADRGVPDAFANDLTGVYATDPGYGANLIALMKLYNLYQFDSTGAPSTAATPATTPTPAASPSVAPSSQPPGPQTVPAHQPQASHPAATATATATGQASHDQASHDQAGHDQAGHDQAGHDQAGHDQAGHQRTGHAAVPGVAAPALAPSVPAVTSATSGLRGAAPAAAGHIPGLVSPGPLAPPANNGHATPMRATPARGIPAPATRAGSAQPRATQPRATPPRGTTAGRNAPRPNPGGASIPGVTALHLAPMPGRTGTAAATAPRRGAPAPGIATANGIVTTARVTRGTAARGPAQYQAQLPHAVTTALFASAKAPLGRGEHLYRDVAACTGISWELLAAVDWMQCKADPRYSPVHGEKIGSLNDDGTSYPTKSAALIQCGCDLIELAAAVYGIDLTARRRLSVRELASAFAAFRWGAILRRHEVSAMEFPYSVAGLTPQHQKMHWPSIDAPDAPDRPGARFRDPFGAVPVVLSLDYPATV
jgi:flagellum-specific peptidoglycan hydrolase FlgJ